MVKLGIYFQGSSPMAMLISLLSSLLWLSSVELYVQTLGQISKNFWWRLNSKIVVTIYHNP